MEAPQKEIYIVTDMQEQDWKDRLRVVARRLRRSWPERHRRSSCRCAAVPTTWRSRTWNSSPACCARAPSRAIAPPCATAGRIRCANVRVRGRGRQHHRRQQDDSRDRAGSVGDGLAVRSLSQCRARSASAPSWMTDALPADNVRRAVAVIRDRVSVLCVEGSSGGGGPAGSSPRRSGRAATAGARRTSPCSRCRGSTFPAQDLAKLRRRDSGRCSRNHPRAGPRVRGVCPRRAMA